MKENKYYIPDISELYVGYETNFISGKGLDKIDNIKNIVITLDNIKTIERDLSLVRTKYLDSDDIISLGFKEMCLSEYKKGMSILCFILIIKH